MTDDLVPGLDAPSPRRAAPRPPRRALRWTIGILLGLLLVIGGAGAGLLWLASSALNKATDGRGGSPVGIFVPLPLSNEDSGHVNVLIAGNSYDDPEHGGALLTDSIMVASVDLETRKTALISVPRDLWVEHDGRQSKINAVFVHAGGGSKGMTALAQAVERATGLHIDHYVLVGYEAVKGVVDAVGGIEVVIESPDPRGIAEGKLKLGNGPQHLDGATALALARARNYLGTSPTSYGLPGGDFDRQKYQRKILTAVVDKARKTPALANPAAVIAIFETLGNNIHTDLNAGQLRRFYDLFADGPHQSVSIRGDSGTPLLVNHTGPGGAAALVPRAGQFEYGEIHAFVAEVLQR